MPENPDVAARLADARPAVEVLQQYVWACRLVGYIHADLTVHAGQVRDWYGSEDGMDLAVLGRDAAAVEAVAAACHQAVDLQKRQITALETAWTGAGADACREFLRRHDAASATVATAVSGAAAALTDAGDRLWQLVDAKAGAVIDIEGRTAASRDQWLAAAATLLTGAGDRAAAAEVVEHAVKPFVDSAIQTEWLTTMRDTIAEVSDAYRTATAEVASEPMPVFAVPGDLGPTPTVDCVEERRCAESIGAAAAPVPACPAAAAQPAAWSAPAAPVSQAAPAFPAAAPAPVVPAAATPPPEIPPAAAAVPPPPAAPVAPPAPLGSSGDMGGGLGGGLSGLGQQFSDTLRGLLGGGGADGFEPPDLDPPELEDPDLEEPDLDEPEEDIEEGAEEGPEDENAETQGTEDAAAVPVDEGAAPLVEEAAPPPADDCAPPAPTPAPEVAPPPVVEPLPPPPPAEPVAAEQTPCEIAAGEVPKVGEQPEPG